MSHLIRLLFCLACLALLGCASNQVVGMSTVQAAEPLPGNSQTVILQVGQTVALAQQDLRIKLLEFQDTRCPRDARCVWAGHATATLSIIRPGAPAQTIVIGTEAPPAMQLPFKVTSGGLLFTLVSLEPQPTAKGAIPVESVRVSVLVEKP